MTARHTEQDQYDQHSLTTEQQEIFNRVMMIVLGFGVGWLLFADKQGYIANVFSEVLGIGGTFFVLDYWVSRRDARQRIQNELVYQAGSTSNAMAKSAIDMCRKRGWLLGANSILKHANLEGAHLAGARLSGANLSGANFLRANLSGAYLRPVWGDIDAGYAKTHGLSVADHPRFDTDLRNAILVEADLTNACMEGVDLRGADLRDAKLSNTNLFDAKFDSATTLPDGTRWKPGSNISQFGAVLYRPDWWPDDSI